jgi:NaMN:DMB phosphoribosyltransferase
MKTYNIFTNEIDTLPKGKADFLLAASVTKTCEIQGITQAGIPGKIPLTPTLDAEYITNEKVYSLGELAETPTGVPTPALITRAIHNLNNFSSIEILELGLDVSAKIQLTIILILSHLKIYLMGQILMLKRFFQKA